MTTASERTRSLRYALEFMTELAGSETVPYEFRQKALRILRHYPNQHEIEMIARVGQNNKSLPSWLEPES